MGLFSGKRPRTLGHTDGTLSPCPRSPNCVSSQSQGGHYIDPIRYTQAPTDMWRQLHSVLSLFPGATIITDDEHYLHVECATPWLGFVDDLEFYHHPDKATIDIRSGSRLGYSDFGKNRQRLEAIRALLTQ